MLRGIRTVSLTLVITGALLVGAGYFVEQRARAFSEQAVREIFTDWNYDTARQLSMRRIRESKRMNSEGPALHLWGKDGLGALQAPGKSFGGVALGVGRVEDPHWLFGHYEFDARFEKGEAHIEIGVVWEDRAWRISSYRFDSDVLHGPPAQIKAAS